jgi:hypothetical protein
LLGGTVGEGLFGPNGIVMPEGRSLTCSSVPGIGLTAWLREFGPVVSPLPPVTSGPASGILLASMFSWGGRCAPAAAASSSADSAASKGNTSLTGLLQGFRR